MDNLIARWRLHNQQIAQQSFTQPEAVVSWMGAMQAQDYGQAVWGIGVRTPGSTLSSIEQALTDARIIRTWPMRGTIHFVPPEDAGWMLQLSAARMIAKDRRRQEQLELTPAILERSQQLTAELLQGRQRVSRSALLQHFEAAGIQTHDGRGYHILWYLAQIGVICLGPVEKNEPSYALLSEWALHTVTRSRDEALAELARRYFTSHGPATLHDFAWWSGLTMADVRQGLEAAKPHLIAVAQAGKTYWMTPQAADSPPPSPLLFLLPGFDEYLLGYTDRADILEPQHASRICPGANGIFFPMIVVDGQIAGVWKRTFKKDSIVITHESFNDWNAQYRDLFEAAAQGYADFVGRKLILV